MNNDGYRFFKPSKDLRELHVLNYIEEDSHISQNDLAEKVGIVPSMANNYIKALKRSSLVRVEGSTNRSKRYFLTPKGRKKKMALLIASSAEIIQMYTATKKEFVGKLNTFYVEGLRRVVLFGAADTCEVVSTAIRDTSIKIAGIVDNDEKKHGSCFGDIVISSPARIEGMDPDGVIITSFGHQEEIYRQIKHLEKKGIRVRKL